MVKPKRNDDHVPSAIVRSRAGTAMLLMSAVTQLNRGGISAHTI